MAEEEQEHEEEQEDKNKRIRPQERARGQKWMKVDTKYKVQKPYLVV